MPILGLNIEAPLKVRHFERHVNMKLARTTFLFIIISVFILNIAGAQSTAKPIDYDAAKIVAEVLEKVGSLEFSTSNSCQILEKRLAKMYENLACQKAAGQFTKAQTAIDEVMKKYKIKAVAEWSVTDNGASRIFISQNRKEAQAINVFVTNNLVLLGY